MQYRTFNKLFSVFACVLLSCLAFSAHSARVDNLYEAMVPVESQDSRLRADALRGVLRAVAVKVSGQSVLPAYFSNSSVSVQHLVEQFGYESIERRDGQRQLQFWARLSSTGVRQILRDQGLPIWPEERPTTLIWLALQDANGQQVIAEGSDHSVMTAIKALSDQRGLPVVLPLMDLAESATVDFTRIAMMSPEHLAEASEKYASQYTLIGHVQQESDKLWRGRWLVAGSNEPETTPVGALEDVVAAAINPLATQVAQQFASFSRSDSPQYIEVTVDDIRSADDYARSLTYLESLSLVSKADVVRLDNKGTHFRLHTRADIAAVLGVIKIDRVLYPRDAIDELIYGLNP